MRPGQGQRRYDMRPGQGQRRYDMRHERALFCHCATLSQHFVTHVVRAIEALEMKKPNPL